MTFETEVVLDRRRLRRRLSFWRVLAAVAGVLALGFLLFSSAERAGLVEQRQIARVTIEGLITEDELKHAEKEVQKLTDQYIAKIDEHLAHKEKEIMTV